jgi:transcriptional regulator with XRE-family HTH domain
MPCRELADPRSGDQPIGTFRELFAGQYTIVQPSPKPSDVCVDVHAKNLAENCYACKQHIACAASHASRMDRSARKVLAENVKALRDHHGWSQAELAGHSGVKQTTISAIEREIHAATVDTISGLAIAFRVSLWSLLIPNIRAANHRAGAAKLLQAYVRLPDEARQEIDRVAEAETRYHSIRP